MKTLITALALATFIAVPAFTQSTVAAPKARRDAGQAGQNYYDSYYNGGYYNHNGTLFKLVRKETEVDVILFHTQV